METGTERAWDRDRSGKSQIVVVDLGEPQASARVDRLRNGKGKLFNRVEKIVNDLVEAGTVKSGAPAVVVVVREFPFPLSLLPRAFDEIDEDED